MMQKLVARAATTCIGAAILLSTASAAFAQARLTVSGVPNVGLEETSQSCMQRVNLILIAFTVSDKACDRRQDAMVLRNHFGKSAAATMLLCKGLEQAWTMERMRLSCKAGARDTAQSFAKRMAINYAITQDQKTRSGKH